MGDLEDIWCITLYICSYFVSLITNSASVFSCSGLSGVDIFVSVDICSYWIKVQLEQNKKIRFREASWVKWINKHKNMDKAIPRWEKEWDF